MRERDNQCRMQYKQQLKASTINILIHARRVCIVNAAVATFVVSYTVWVGSIEFSILFTNKFDFDELSINLLTNLQNLSSLSLLVLADESFELKSCGLRIIHS